MHTSRLVFLSTVFFFLGFFLLFAGTRAPILAQTQGERDLVLRDVRLVDLSSGRIEDGRTVRIRGEKIVEILSTEKSNPTSSDRVIEGKGRYLLPGLWDMHVHLSDSTPIALPLLVAQGVTGVRDMGGDLEQIDAWRKEIALGKRIGPRILRPGPYVDGEKPGAPFRETVRTAKDGRRVVGELMSLGVDFVKIHNRVPREAYFALAEECARRNFPFAGHLPFGISAREASDAGQKSIEHIATLFEGTFAARYKDPVSMLAGVREFKEKGEAREVFAQFAKNETWFTPTLIGYWLRPDRPELAKTPDPRTRYVARSLREQWDKFFPVRETDHHPRVIAGRRQFIQDGVELVGMMHEQGVKLLAATDLAGRDLVPGFSLHEELELLVRAGLSPLEALRTATLHPAEFLGLEDSLGKIAPGYAADGVLLEKNPLETIQNTMSIEAVVARGRYLPRVELDRLLESVASQAESH